MGDPVPVTLATSAVVDSAAPFPLNAPIAGRFSRRIAPFLALLYFFLFLDRQNITFAGLTMSKDLGLSATAFGLAIGMFSLGYFVFEIPSTLMTRRYGARRWLARIMVSWGLLSAITAFATDSTTLYAIRFLLGAAEAGFVPGVIYYLTQWAPARERGRIIGLFMIAVPMASILGAPLSGWLLGADWLGLHGWRWLFIVEGLPSCVLGVAIFAFLPDGPEEVDWLSASEKSRLRETLREEHDRAASVGHATLASALASPTVWLLGLIYLGNGVGLFGVSAWLPTLLKQTGLSFVQTGFVFSFIYVLMAIYMLVWTRHSDLTGERIWHVALPSVFGVLCIVAGALASSPIVSLVFLGLSGILMNPATPAFWNLPPKYLSGAGAAAGIAFISSIGALGAFIGPAMLGFVKDHSGNFSYGLLLLAAGPALSAALTISLLWRPAFAKDA